MAVNAEAQGDTVRVEVGLLGPLVLTVDGDPIEAGAPMERSLLSTLALSPGRAVSLTELASALWDEDLPSSWRKSVQVHVSRVRQRLTALGVQDQIIETEGDGYVLRVEPADVDVCRFDSLVHEGREWLARAKPERAVEAFLHALQLWRGRPLQDLDGRLRWNGTCARLVEEHANAVEGRIEAALALGRNEATVPIIEAAVSDDPLRERLWALLMIALYRSGRQADALRAFQRARNVLVEELGIDPSAELTRLEGLVIAQSPELHLTEVVPSQAHGSEESLASVIGAELASRPLEPLVGRERQLAVIRDAWRRAHEGIRTVLVSGADGIGKSHLAAHFEAELRQRGAPVMRVWCEPGGASPFLLVRQAVEQALDVYWGLQSSRWRDDEIAALAELSPYLARHLGNSPKQNLPLDPYSAAMALRRIMYRADTPTNTLVVDDIQWLDEPSIDMFRHLLTEPEGMPLLVLATHRRADSQARPALWDLFTTGMVQGQITELRLDPLDAIAASELVDHVLGEPGEVGHVSGGERADLLASAAGNPGLLRELALAHRAESTTGAGSSVPASVVHLVSRTCRRLDAADREVLGAASVLGATFSLDDLERVTGAGRMSLLHALGRAEDRDLVYVDPDEPTCYRFAAPAVAEAVAAELHAGLRHHFELRAGAPAGQGSRGQGPRLASRG